MAWYTWVSNVSFMIVFVAMVGVLTYLTNQGAATVRVFCKCVCSNQPLLLLLLLAINSMLLFHIHCRLPARLVHSMMTSMSRLSICFRSFFVLILFHCNYINPYSEIQLSMQLHLTRTAGELAGLCRTSITITTYL